MEIKIFIDMDGKAGEAFHETEARRDEPIRDATVVAIGGLPHGMSSGKTSVGICLVDAEGKPYYVQTSLKMMQLAMAALDAEYGDETDGETYVVFDPKG